MTQRDNVETAKLCAARGEEIERLKAEIERLADIPVPSLESLPKEFAQLREHHSTMIVELCGSVAKLKKASGLSKAAARGKTIASLQAKLTAAKAREKALAKKCEQLTAERDTYMANELTALKSWQKALDERDSEARKTHLNESERDAIEWLSGLDHPRYMEDARKHARVAKSLLERSKTGGMLNEQDKETLRKASAALERPGFVSLSVAVRGVMVRN